MLRSTFPAHTYVTLEDIADRTRARQDPQGFLGRLRGPALIDDVHRVPELLQYMDGPRALILGSSIRLETPLETFELYPPTQAELEGRRPLPLEILGRFEPGPTEGIKPAARPFVRDRTWLDRDVRALIQVHDLDRFEEFVSFAETTSGGIVFLKALAEACGLSLRTVTRWLGVMMMCFRIVALPASGMDFGRRLRQSPKLHYFDSTCLETRAVVEIYKNARHSGVIPDLSYWCDSNGFEIPLIIQTDTAPLMPVSIVGEPTPRDVVWLRRWMDLAGVTQGAIISERGGQLPRRGVVGYGVGQL